MNCRLALTIWRDQISPVFDAAREALLLELVDGQRCASRTLGIGDVDAQGKIDLLTELEVEVLICGAISRAARELATQRMRLIPFVAGRREQVLAAFIAGALPAPELAMPGCSVA